MSISELAYAEFEAYMAGTANPEVVARIGAMLDDPDSDLSRWFGERHNAIEARKRRHHYPLVPTDSGEGSEVGT